MNNFTKIIFIGTGSGKILPDRYHSSFIIEHNNFNLLVDAGDSVSRALLKSEIDLNSIDAIIISHFHPDHICGLPSLLIQMKMLNRKNSVKLFVHKSLLDDLKRLLVKTYVIPERLSFEISFETYNFDSQITLLEDFKVRTYQNSHLNKYEYFVKSEKISTASSSFVFLAGNKKIYYSGDVGTLDDLEQIDEQKLDIFISEVTHLEPGQIVKKAELYTPSMIVFTHISGDLDPEIDRFVRNHTEKPAILAAFDGMNLVI